MAVGVIEYLRVAPRRCVCASSSVYSAADRVRFFCFRLRFILPPRPSYVSLFSLLFTTMQSAVLVSAASGLICGVGAAQVRFHDDRDDNVTIHRASSRRLSHAAGRGVGSTLRMVPRSIIETFSRPQAPLQTWRWHCCAFCSPFSTRVEPAAEKRSPPCSRSDCVAPDWVGLRFNAGRRCGAIIPGPLLAPYYYFLL